MERQGCGGERSGALGSAEIDKSWASRKLWGELELIKSESLHAWGRSQAGKTTTGKKVVSGEKDSREEESEQTVTSAGDPRFLGIAKDVIHDQALLIGLIEDGKSGKGLASPGEVEADDSETIAIIEVTSRDQARTLEGKRFCRVADSSNEVVDDGGQVESKSNNGEGK